MMAPLVPRIVLMKNSWNPLVAACVTMKSPTPSTMQDRLISMARFFAVRNRSAMRKFWDIRVALLLRGEGVGWYFLGADTVAHPEAVEVVHDDEVAGLEAVDDLRPGEPDEAPLHAAHLHLAPHDDL